MYLYRHLLDKLGSFGSADLHLTPILKELPTDENSTGEEVGVWLIKCTEGFLWHLNWQHSYFHICKEMQRFLFSCCIFSLCCFGEMTEEQ